LELKCQHLQNTLETYKQDKRTKEIRRLYAKDMLLALKITFPLLLKISISGLIVEVFETYKTRKIL
jgi:cell division protein FtsL